MDIYRVFLKNNVLLAYKNSETVPIQGKTDNVEVLETAGGSKYTFYGLNKQLQQIPLENIRKEDNSAYTKEEWENIYTNFSSASGGSEASFNFLTDFKVEGVTGTNPTARIDLPTPDGSGQATHFTLEFVPEGFRGAKFFKGATGFTDGDDSTENPLIWNQNNTGSWVVPSFPPGFTNPIEPQPPTEYYADTCLRYWNKNMYMFYRYFLRAEGENPAEYYIKVNSLSETADAWSAQRNVITLPYGGGSPVILRYFDKFLLFHVDFLTDNQAGTLYKMDSTTIDSGYSNEVTCTVHGIYTGKRFWHTDIVNVNGQLIMLANCCDIGTNGTNGVLQLGVSNDGGLNFYLASNLLLPTGNTGLFDTHYRSGIIFKYPDKLYVSVAGVSDGTPAQFNNADIEVTLNGTDIIVPDQFVFDNVTYPSDNHETTPTNLFVSGDDNSLFILGLASDSIQQYTLNNAGLLTSVTYLQAFDLTSVGSNLLGGCMSPDGTYILCAFADAIIRKVDLTTPYTLAGGATLSTQTLDVSTQNSAPRSLHIDSTGTNLQVTGFVNNDISQFLLLTPNDISTGFFFTSSGDLGFGNISCINVSSDGTTATICNNTSTINQINYGTPGLVTSITNRGTRVVSGFDSISTAWTNSGVKCFTYQFSDKTIRQNSCASYDITI